MDDREFRRGMRALARGLRQAGREQRRAARQVQRAGRGSVSIQSGGNVVLGGVSGEMMLNGVRITGAVRDVQQQGGRLTVNGRELSDVRAGDHVHVEADGSVTVNGKPVT